MMFVFSFSSVLPNKNLQVIDDIHQNKLYLVLEYAEGGPIMQTNHRVAIPENQARKHFLEICCGLDYLHYHKVRSLSFPIWVWGAIILSRRIYRCSTKPRDSRTYRSLIYLFSPHEIDGQRPTPRVRTYQSFEGSPTVRVVELALISMKRIAVQRWLQNYSRVCRRILIGLWACGYLGPPQGPKAGESAEGRRWTN